MDPFQEYTDRYDRWFETYEPAYESEVDALKQLIPSDTHGLEIGVGTGRFAKPLGLKTGIDPSSQMLDRASERGISVVRGIAEALPFEVRSFETALIVTTICFVNDIQRTLAEANRILKTDGQLVIGYIDKESPVGQMYHTHKEKNPFYRGATFVSTNELIEHLTSLGFGGFEYVQTVFEMPGELTEPDPVRSGFGDGSFVGLKASPESK